MHKSAARYTNRALVDLLVLALEETLTRTAADGGKHQSTCRVGLWLAGYTFPAGAPCSPKCTHVRHLIREARERLERVVNASGT